MTKKEILNTPEIVDFMIDKSVMVDSKMKLHKRLDELCKLAIKALEQPKWIPVGERLPEDNELVLFSTKTDRVFEGRFFSDNTDRQWYSFRDETFAWNNVVTAWMPLPKPYKEGGAE